VTVDLSELDQVCTMIPHRDIIEDRGFTINDLAVRLKCPRPTANGKMLELLQAGKVRTIGYRPGRNGEKVYELTK